MLDADVSAEAVGRLTLKYQLPNKRSFNARLREVEVYSMDCMTTHSNE
jgi:hypothetical protein